MGEERWHVQEVLPVCLYNAKSSHHLFCLSQQVMLQRCVKCNASVVLSGHKNYKACQSMSVHHACFVKVMPFCATHQPSHVPVHQTGPHTKLFCREGKRPCPPPLLGMEHVTKKEEPKMSVVLSWRTANVNVFLEVSSCGGRLQVGRAELSRPGTEGKACRWGCGVVKRN